MIRSKGEAGTGNIVEAVRHIRTINEEIEVLRSNRNNNKKLASYAKEYRVPLSLVKQTAMLGRLPVVNFAAGGIATPADAALCMQLGVDGVFVGSGIFKSSNPAKNAKAIVDAIAHYRDAKKIAEVSEGIGDPMPGLEIESLKTKLAERGV